MLAYELLSGRPPFEVEDERETKQRIMSDTDIKFPTGGPAAGLAGLRGCGAGLALLQHLLPAGRPCTLLRGVCSGPALLRGC